MHRFEGLAIGLSLVFGFLLLALLAEVYYLLWWRKRINSVSDEEESVNENSSYAKDILHLICLKRPNLSNPNSIARLRPLGSQNGRVGMNEPIVNGPEQDPEVGISRDLPLKSEEEEEEAVDAELMRLHNLAGPPRFLFPITEETREDMESDDGKSTRKGSRTRSLSDLLVVVETSQVSPLKPSPSPNTNVSETGFRFNPTVDRSSSPPPKFKFLRDAEEKLLKRPMEEAEKRGNDVYGSVLKLGVVETKEMARDQIVPNLCNFPSSSSQVLSLASSPTANFRHIDEKLASIHRS